jgi:signal recognition particle subunit SRP54
MPKELKGAKIGDDELKPVEAIIRSMTPLERRKPELINGSRRTRIANGSGTTVGDVNRLVKQFGEMQKMMKRMGGMGMGRGGKGKAGKGKPGKGKTAKRAFTGLPAGMPGGMPDLPGMPGMPGLPSGFPRPR